MSSSSAKKGKTSTNVRYIYAFLIVLRVYSALRGYGYVHPDEWMQADTSLLTLGQGLTAVETTWEWEPDHAIRSPTSLSHASFPLRLVKKLLPEARSAFQLFLLQRAVVLCRSFAIDASIRFMFPSNLALKILCLLAVSTSATVFNVRPFSNAYESQMLAMCFACVLSLHAKTKRQAVQPGRRDVLTSIIFGVCVAEGLFARFTFAIFALPLTIFFIRKVCWGSFRNYRLTVLLTTAVSFSVTSTYIVFADTQTYSRLAITKGSRANTLMGSRWVVAPFNALMYNLRTENVALHGLHPRWLHSCVNFPIMFGVSSCFAVLSQLGLLVRPAKCHAQGDRARHQDSCMEMTAVRLSMATIVFSLTVLSISPHQEPRFLLPLALPCVIVFTHVLQAPLLTTRSRLARFLVAIYVVQHALQLAFFGFAHQSGLLPALFAVDDNAVRGPDSHIVIWRTFDVPLHLMQRVQTRSTIHAFSGSTTSPTTIYQLVANSCDHTTIVLPAYAVVDLQTAVLQHDSRVRLKPIHSPLWPHLDMDHLSETAAAARSHGWKHATSVHILHVKCSSETASAESKDSAAALPTPIPSPPVRAHSTSPQRRTATEL